jgi:hypothetical protein
MKPKYAYALLAILIAGCASLGTEPAQTFSQKLAYGYATHTAVLQATTSALTAGTISSADAESILKQADTARAGLDAAKQAHDAGDISGGDSKLAIALTGLQALQDYLRAHGAKP